MATNEAVAAATTSLVVAAPAAASTPMPAVVATSKKDGTHEVEQSLEVLDKVLSEYDERDTPLSSLELGAATATASVVVARSAAALTSAPRQSEDDGYVSMNGRRCFSCTADYRSRPTDGDATTNSANTTTQLMCTHAAATTPPADGAAQQQVTLPKTRTTDMISRFASLPSTTAAMPAAAGSLGRDGGVGTPPRAILGIGISAVHSAVLSGVTRIPETIVNEHPVTIYPGRCSPTKRNSNSASPRNPSGSGGPASPRSTTGEPNDNNHPALFDSSTTTTTAAAMTISAAAAVATFGVTRSPSASQQRSAAVAASEQEHKLSKLFASAMRSSDETEGGPPPSNELITLKSVFSNAAVRNNNGGSGGENRRTYIGLLGDGDETEEFSDDSLEEAVTTEHDSSHTPSLASSMASLPPPQQQQQQQQQQLAPLAHQQRQVADVHAVPNGVTDDDDGNDDAAAEDVVDNGPWVLRDDVLARKAFDRKSNLIEPLDYSYTSTTTATNNAHHNHHHHHDEIEAYAVSAAAAAANDDDAATTAMTDYDEWPQPPEPASNNSTSTQSDDDDDEDDDDEEGDGGAAGNDSEAEAAAAGNSTSTASSAEVKINDTYVIRKGCKQRISVQQYHQFSPPIRPPESGGAVSVAAVTAAVTAPGAEQLCTTNAKFVSSIRVPFTRHSIDLGGAGAGGGAADPHKHAARTRLSLDLGSPNKALPPPPTQPSAPSPTPSSVHHAAATTPVSYPHHHHQPPQQQGNNNNNNAKAVLSPRYSEFKKYKSTFDAFYALDVTNSNHHQQRQQQQQQQQQQHYHHYHQQQQHNPHNNNAAGICSTEALDDDRHPHHHADGAALMRVSSLPSISPAISGEKISTPRRELAPPLEEDEEQDSERDVPLRQIENKISALLRGDIAVARVTEGNNNAGRRPSIGLRSGVHKSESAKEMLLSQNMFGPLPPSPPASLSSQELRSDDDVTTPLLQPPPLPSSSNTSGAYHHAMHSQDSYGFPPLPPLPPSPTDHHQMLSSTAAYTEIGPATAAVSFSTSSARRSHGKSSQRRESASGGGPERPPSIPPHRGPSNNTLKTRSMDAGISRSHRSASASSHQFSSPQCPPKSNSYDKHRSSSGAPSGPQPPPPPPPASCGTNTRRRMMPNGFPKRIVQSPRDEHRLQTSLSLPETPIFARGCDVPRTPHRRTQPDQYAPGGSRTAPRQQTSCLNSSVIGIGNTLDSRPKMLGHQPFAGGEMLRLAGGPARGWYPRQRQQQQHQQQRPLSTENLEGLSTHSRSARFWDGETPGGGRKPLTLPPNLSPKFFNKSPRDALRRVTSLLIRKGASESKKDRDASIKRNFHHAPTDEVSSIAQPKKKGFFKSFWKKSKHISLDK